MVGGKWTRERARGGNVGEEMKGHVYKATHCKAFGFGSG